MSATPSKGLLTILLISCALAVSPLGHAQDAPPPPSVSKEINDGASAPDAAKTKKPKSKSKRGKLKAKGSIQTDNNAAENMSTTPETGNMSPALTPGGGAGFNFKF